MTEREVSNESFFNALKYIGDCIFAASILLGLFLVCCAFIITIGVD